ncbi:MAG: hypothetical protein HZR80_15265 [Candidatus Heimdallarchaeota archaeon]
MLDKLLILMNTKHIRLLTTFLIAFTVFAHMTSFVLANDDPAPITRTYFIPLESWAFIKETDLIANQVIIFEWISELTIQSIEVTEHNYQLMQGMSLTERSVYYENLGYLEVKSERARTTTSDNGTIYFVFFNPNNLGVDVDFTFTYKSNNIQPWVIGLISAIAIIIVLSIGFYIAMRLRRKMLLEQFEEEEKSPAQKYLEM